MATLGLSIPRPRRTVFREVVALLRADPELNRVVKTWLVWDGADDSAAVPGYDAMPAVRITPGHSGDDFYGPCGSSGWLEIDVEVWTPGLDMDDPLDLFGCIDQCFAPVRTEPRAILVAAGAETGEPLIAWPAYAPAATSGTAHAIYARGAIRIKVVFTAPDN